MLTNLLMLLAGLALLVWSADRFVLGAASLARNLGLPPLIIGLTVVSMGSSAPEAMVATTAAMDGYLDTAIGNVLGSNIANITLILGATALLSPLMVASSTLFKEIPLMLASTLFAGWLMWDKHLSLIDGVLLFIVFIVVISGLTRSAWLNRENDPMLADSEAELPDELPMPKSILWLIVGMALLPFASDIMVNNAVVIAKWFGMSDLVIGLTIIAVGTSLPELAACIAGVLKNEDDLVMGNLVGSNLFNILAVLALPAMIAPGAIDALAIERDYLIVLATSFAPLLLLLLHKKHRIGRIEGGILLLCFIAYQSVLLFQGG